MSGDVDDAVLGHVARVEIVFVHIEIEPDVSLSTRGFGEPGNLFGFSARALQSHQWEAFHCGIGGRWCSRSGYVRQRALNAEAANFCVTCRRGAGFVRACIARVEYRIGNNQHCTTRSFGPLLLDSTNY